MLQSTGQLLLVWFRSVWTLLTCFYIPGTNVTPAGFMLFIASAVIGIHFIKNIFNSIGGISNDKE